MANVKVPPIEIRPFEKEIIDSFKAFAPIKGRGGRSSPHKGVWIREHLQTAREDYSYGMWKRWTRFCRIADVLTAKIEAGTYDNFRVYVWLLKKLDLILFTREIPGRSPALEFYKHFYRVNPAELQSPLWENPWRDYDSHRRWARRKFRPPGVKPKRKKGRPPKHGSTF